MNACPVYQGKLNALAGLNLARANLAQWRLPMALDYSEYIIDEPYRQHGYGNGYDPLDGEWLTYYKVASKFAHKAQAQDREDLLHTIILNLAVAGRNNGHKPDNPSWMYRIASFTVAQYWRDYYKRINGIDCGHCSNSNAKSANGITSLLRVSESYQD